MSNKQHKPGYKHTPLGWIPDDWDIEKVGELCDFIVPGRNKPTLFDGDIPWITTPDIENHEIVYSSKIDLKLSKEEAKKVGSKIVPKNSIIMSCVGELGIVAITGNEVVINQQLHAFIPKGRIDVRFLLYALSFQNKYIESVATKTAVPYLNKTNCNSIPIPFPKICEQIRIGKILSMWDEAIQKTQQLIERLKLRNKGLSQQLLSGKKRLQGFSCKWKEYLFDDCFKIVRSYSLSREYLSQKNELDNIYCIHYGDIHALYKTIFLDFDIEKRIPQIINQNFVLKEEDYLVDGDIIMADASEDYEGVGEAVEVINLNDKKAVGGLHTIVIREIKDLSHRGFLAFLFDSENVRNELRTKATGTSVYSISKATLKSLRFKLPGLDEQKAVTDFLSESLTELKLYEEQLITLQQQKKGLMQKLLSGEVRIKI